MDGRIKLERTGFVIVVVVLSSVSVETDCDIQTGDKLKKNLIRWLCYAVRSIVLSCFESTCPLGERNHCKSILRRSELSPLAYDETFLMGVVSSRKNNTTIHRAQGVIDDV